MINTIKKLKELGKEGFTTIEIYYAEDIDLSAKEWSVDVLNNIICKSTSTSWCWTVTSTTLDNIYHKNCDDYMSPVDYEIIVDELFSDDVVCKAIETWLSENGLDKYGFEVKMIDFDAAAPYSGYIAELLSRDIDEELKTAVPMEDISDL